MSSLTVFLENITELPSPPAVATKLMKEVKKDKLAIQALVDIISYDPSLSANILKVANSAFYSLPYKVGSLDKAVSILGINALKNIALSFVLVKGLKRNSIDGFDHELFWKRSLTAAVSSEIIAAKLNVRMDERFIIPLLMDIGILVMYLVDHEKYLKVLDEKRISNLTTIEAERSVFGYNHQEVGSEILRNWGLPENIYTPIAYHHDLQNCPPQMRDTVNLLILSDMASSVYHGKKSIEKFRLLKQHMQDKLPLAENDVENLIDSIAKKTVEILSSYEIDAGNLKPYSKVLEDAVQELGKLNLSYEQLIMELKQEKMKVELLAKELKTANEKLSELALKDDLTTLYNSRFFQELMERELESAKRYANHLSLIMIDIDRFKKINDTYGHPEGNVVLRSIATLFKETIRKSDIAVRYGGEEFAIILPMTNLKTAFMCAEMIRKKVEKTAINIDNASLKITISLGIASYAPGEANITIAEIIKEADKALYNSKQAGRNKTSIMQL